MSSKRTTRSVATPATDALEAWALPGEVARAADPTAGQPRHRTVRDWVVDTGAFLYAVVTWVGERFGFLASLGVPDWLYTLDLAAGAVLCLAIWWRRRFPVALGIAAVLVASVSNSATGAVLVALFTLALHRGWRWSVPAVPLALLLGTPYVLVYFPPYLGSPVVWLALIAATLAFAVSAGLGVRARRQVVLVLAERAEDARRESELRLEGARQTERERIAREMHDVLAHRLSLLAVHAGALQFRIDQAESHEGPPPTAPELQDSAEVIRRNAHLALEELRGVLQVLRADGAHGPEDTAPPQPGLSDVTALVEEVRASGQHVTVQLDAEDVPAGVGRTVYRVVQEGLTNARKHAPGARVAVGVRTVRDGGPWAVVTVTNPLPVGVTERELAGAQAGLHGLDQRVRLHRDGDRGGTLTHGAADGAFTLEARIPWAA
ncbi:sensor histidine kinase [Georgenia alba]|uniref:histidine kinase n=1 Tax=Georgenia alba TaxID=2233858 RepID=A0ABW2QGQ9_9MICO